MELTALELRLWFKRMAASDYSEKECRAVLGDAVDMLPIRWLEAEWHRLYSDPLTLVEKPTGTRFGNLRLIDDSEVKPDDRTETQGASD
jgi:hypothetical protein